MKTTATQNKTSTSSSSQPFFNKGGEGTFFANKKEATTPFFQAQAIQKSLAVGSPNDPFEQEADKVGRQVMDNFGAASGIQAKLSNLGIQTSMIQPMTIGTRISRMVQRRHDMIQQKCAGCEEEDMMAQPKTMGIQFSGDGAMVSQDIENRIQSQRGSGQSMDNQTKTAMESSFGADFSSVNIHTGTPAVQMSQELNAHAFTVGNDIFFNKGRYQPQTKEGAGLLAHELTHTVQQGAAVQNKRISKRPFSQMLSKHAMGHLSTMNENTLSRKEMTQLQNLPEEELMQQKEIFESNEVDKVQKKDSKLSLRRCDTAKKTKTVSLHINHLEKGPTGHASDLQKAKDTYKAANIDLKVVKNETFNDAETKAILGADYILDEYSSVGTPTAEETKLLAAPKGVTKGAISMYYVKSLSAGSTGESFWAKDWPGVNPSVVLSSADTKLTFSHELGHVLLNDGGHHPDPDNLMFNFNQKYELDSTQKTKIYNSPLAK